MRRPDREAIVKLLLESHIDVSTHGLFGNALQAASDEDHDNREANGNQHHKQEVVNIEWFLFLMRLQRIMYICG
jgi:hypothetical protein